MLREIVSAMARSRRGMALLPMVIGVAAVGLLIYSVLRWYFSMVQGTAGLGDELEMQAITQEYLGRINAATYDEIVQTVAAKGSSWTEDVGGKYEVKYEIGEDGKFADAKCDTEAVIGDGDKHCRTATITLTSKNDPTQVMNLSTISVATTGRIPEIQRRLTAQDDKFDEYYTKGDGDGHFACPWDYKMNAANTACVPCDAPTWKQYRNGNCSLFTCPTGEKPNAAGNGCEAITCPADKVLEGDYCVDPIPKGCFSLPTASIPGVFGINGTAYNINAEPWSKLLSSYSGVTRNIYGSYAFPDGSSAVLNADATVSYYGYDTYYYSEDSEWPAEAHKHYRSVTKEFPKGARIRLRYYHKCGCRKDCATTAISFHGSAEDSYMDLFLSGVIENDGFDSLADGLSESDSLSDEAAVYDSDYALSSSRDGKGIIPLKKSGNGHYKCSPNTYYNFTISQVCIH